MTADGSGTKITKLTKITKSLFGFVVFVTFVVFVPHPSGVSGQAPQPSQPPPVFRTGATYVRVDAYPTLGGDLIHGLTKDDFELFEDDKPQTIAAAEFVTFGEPDDARGSMLSAREGLELASERLLMETLDRVAHRGGGAPALEALEAASAAWGSRLVSVNPGMTLDSST